MTERLTKYKKQFLDEWFAFSSPMMFIAITVTYIALMYVKRIFIINEIGAFEVLNDRGDLWIFDLIYNIQYFSVPIFLAWKWTWTSLVLWIGCFMFGYRIHYNQLWKMVMMAELWFFLPEILKVIWFTIFYTDPSYFDYLAFYPFSLINFYDYSELASQWTYPLKALNLFEIAYWFILTLGVFFIGGKKLRISAYIVFSSYVLSFLIWLSFYLLVY